MCGALFVGLVHRHEHLSCPGHHTLVEETRGCFGQLRCTLGRGFVVLHPPTGVVVAEIARQDVVGPVPQGEAVLGYVGPDVPDVLDGAPRPGAVPVRDVVGGPAEELQGQLDLGAPQRVPVIALQHIYEREEQRSVGCVVERPQDPEVQAPLLHELQPQPPKRFLELGRRKEEVRPARLDALVGPGPLRRPSLGLVGQPLAQLHVAVEQVHEGPRRLVVPADGAHYQLVDLRPQRRAPWPPRSRHHYCPNVKRS